MSTHRFIASARVECHGPPAHAYGVLAVGGLLAARGIAMTSSATSIATANYLFPPWIKSEPDSAWAWSNVFGVVTNWQFSGQITFQWAVHCYPSNA